jgi:hypothetical protein
VTEVETSINATASKQTEKKSRMTWKSAIVFPDTHIKLVGLLRLLSRFEAVGG